MPADPEEPEDPGLPDEPDEGVPPGGWGSEVEDSMLVAQPPSASAPTIASASLPACLRDM